jgi:hypothetical protein
MKTITKLTLTLLLMSITLFANTPSLEKLKTLVNQVEKNEKIVLALAEKFPNRNTLSSESEEVLITTVKSEVKAWKVNYKKMKSKLNELSKKEELQKSLEKYKERKPFLKLSYADYVDYIKRTKVEILAEITGYWKENLKVRTWYIDMYNGSNANDGLSDTTAFENDLNTWLN